MVHFGCTIIFSFSKVIKFKLKHIFDIRLTFSFKWKQILQQKKIIKYNAMYIFKSKYYIYLIFDLKS